MRTANTTGNRIADEELDLLNKDLRSKAQTLQQSILHLTQQSVAIQQQITNLMQQVNNNAVSQSGSLVVSNAGGSVVVGASALVVDDTTGLTLADTGAGSVLLGLVPQASRNLNVVHTSSSYFVQTSDDVIIVQ